MRLSTVGERITIFGKVVSTPVVVWGLAGAALLWHASLYDFFCDDGFIALRYSQSLLTNGELTYNPGEKVEGFTSPLWVFLVALFGLFGGSLVTCAKLVGALSALGTLGVTYHLWRGLAPQHSSKFAYLPMGLLVVSPPLAAWTLGGLEAPLFALALSATLVLVARAHDQATSKSWLLAGVLAGLSGLARPEGMGVALLCLALSLVQSLRTKRWALVTACAAPIAAILGGYVAFRLAYYGYPFPNTFYVKTSGGNGLARRGVAYVTAMARQFGWPTVVALAVAIVMPLFAPRRYLAVAKQHLSFGVLAVMARALVVGFVVYLVRIGGDFLDLYRFFAPVLPLAFCLIVSELLNLFTALRAAALRTPWLLALVSRVRLNWACYLAASAVGFGLLFSYGQHSLWMGAGTLAGWYSVPRDAPRRPKGVEPIRWTRKAAHEWAALGRILAKRAKRGDTMAMGAAGAGPYAAKLPNLDLYGLTDKWVSHHGRVVSSRPGHQRFATNEYILKWKPTFLFIQPSGSRRPMADAYWNARGYVSATIEVGGANGPVKRHYVSVLVRESRVKALRRYREWTFL